MSNIQRKLNGLKTDISDELMVHFIFISLPSQYSQFMVTYNCQKETWTLNELMAHCVQEEERQKKSQKESVNIAINAPKGNKKRKQLIKVKDKYKTTLNNDAKKGKKDSTFANAEEMNFFFVR
jgi:gag-polypeptide of LTR copia-type